jgi:hypothetical protein
MQIHVFSIAVIVFALGAVVSPVPPPAAIVSQVQDILASSPKAMPALQRSAASIVRDVASAE